MSPTVRFWVVIDGIRCYADIVRCQMIGGSQIRNAKKHQDERSLDMIFAHVRHMHHHQSVAMFEEVGLLFGQPPVLFHLEQKDGQTQAELARQMNRTPATVTATLTRMEHDGWIERRRDPNDNRVLRVFLTEKAHGVREEMARRMWQFEAVTFAGFTESELALLRRFFLQMEENLEAEGARRQAAQESETQFPK